MKRKKVKQDETLTIKLSRELKAQIAAEAEKDARTVSNLGGVLLGLGLEAWKSKGGGKVAA